MTDIARVSGRAYNASLELKLKEWVERDDLIVSKRKPPAVRKQTQSKPPAPAGPGYKDDTLPPPIK